MYNIVHTGKPYLSKDNLLSINGYNNSNSLIDITMKLHWVKSIAKGKPMPMLWKLFVSKKILIFIEDLESAQLLYFKNLKQYCNETNATIEASYFIS